MLFHMDFILDAGGTRSVVLLALRVGLAKIPALQFECFWIDGGFGVVELKNSQGVDEDGRDGDVAIPLVV